MIKIMLLAALVACVSAGGLGYGLGYGYVSAGHGYGHGYGHHGGVARVNAHQTPFNYNFALNEGGAPGYGRYHYQGAATNLGVGVVGYGHGYGHGYGGFY